jgi:hypothetical protein
MNEKRKALGGALESVAAGHANRFWGSGRHAYIEMVSLQGLYHLRTTAKDQS